MATPFGPVYLELVGATSTLLIGSRAIRLQNADGLTSRGRSRGGDLAKAGIAGRTGKRRVRDSLRTSFDTFLEGRYDQDGMRVADPVANGWALHDLVEGWPDSQDRQFVARLHTFSTVREGDVRFEGFGDFRELDHRMWRVSWDITIVDGLLTAAT